MGEFAKEVLPVSLEEEMRQSYMDYAMSVIVGRALPDVRDGFKPVHRRVLYAMKELGIDWNRPYKKSARVVGDVIGKYHPHGDAAVYDTIVRMAQPFNMRYPLVDGQGNFGSIDGDAAAAMRYTEVRMARISHEMLADIDKQTVDFVPNYDETESEPAVLPTRLPNLLVNGSAGIAVGMATNIPPHNLGEIIDGCIALIDDPDLSLEALMRYIPGPDFPTGATINGARGIREAYATGRGRIWVRGKTHVEEDEKTGRETIVVTELPFQVNKARLIEKIAELVKDKKLEGISELRDESDKDGMRIVIELKRGEMAEVVLNNLYQQTQLQNVFGINMVALVDNQPRTLNLIEVLEAFLRHRREVVTRRSLFELAKARDRAHVLEGLAVALADIDEVIRVIRESSGPAEAREALCGRTWNPGVVRDMLTRSGDSDSYRPEGLSREYGLNDEGRYRLSEAQAKAILDLRLHRLTALEQDKIVEEYEQLLATIDDLLDILTRPERLMQVIREELEAIRDEYGDARRTEILEQRLDLTLEDLISEEDRVVTLSHQGYVKGQALDTYQAQKRGGRGKAATRMKSEDFIDTLFVANTHDTLLCFTSAGKVYWKKVYELPTGSRNSRGIPIVNLLPLEDGERVNAVLPVTEFDEDHFVFMATRGGTVKKTPLADFSRPRSSGIIAIDLRGGDELVGAVLTDGERDVMLVADDGKSIRFAESDVRAMGRTAAGVRGIRLPEDGSVISLDVVRDELLLTATENGYGKCTRVEEHTLQGRGGQGLIAIQASERNGRVVAATPVSADDDVMLISNAGTLVRTAVADISVLSRNTQGVRLIRLGKDEKLVQAVRIESLGDEDEGQAEDETTD